ncbi:methyl-accepting chemotaxis protein [Halanaerobiaceae bacterium Z-7014]|uniref:Methyl-accepting chemotaxis protein n=1 Tax=Halonatronomonas betaini TaxID=2778430 RepID=A0A931AZY4_9FIRM|nr:methyl-accepting chemotaxis protein [Halonatronomonas betaini]MBF8437873.1 methyl-accepting chemotaxis protein [Halonatronomonas betaini]
MFKSIKTRLVVFIGLLILLLIAGSSFYSFRQSRDILDDTLRSEALNSARRSVETINLWSEEKGKIIQNLSYLDSIKSMDWDRQYDDLLEMARDDDQIESLFVVEPDGTMRDTNQYETNVSDQSYFQSVTADKEQVFSEPTESFETGRPITIIASPVFNDDEFVGIVGGVVALDILRELTANMDISGHGYGMIVDQNQNIIAHPEADYLGNQDIYSDLGDEFYNLVSESFQESEGYGTYQFENEDWDLAYATVDNTDWTVFLTASQANLFAPLDIIRNSSFATGLIAILLGIIVSYLIARMIVNPIISVNNLAQKIAGGNLTERVNLTDFNVQKEDEIGQLLTAINKMVENLQDTVRPVQKAAENLSSTSRGQAEAGAQVERSAEEVATAIQNVASGAEEQSAQIDEMETIFTDLSNQISRTGDMAENMSAKADKVVENVEKGSNSVDNSVESVNNVKSDAGEVAEIINDLGETSNEIGDIIEIISSIASQTNLLALNAAIEAARAGEAGRGFSVVAEEIRQLAEESASATEKINNLIVDIQENAEKANDKMDASVGTVESSVSAIKETGEVFNDIKKAVFELDQLIEKVTEEARDMDQNSVQLETAVGDISKVSEEAASNAEEVAASSEEQIASTEEIISFAEELSRMSEELEETINKFEI